MCGISWILSISEVNIQAIDGLFMGIVRVTVRGRVSNNIMVSVWHLV